MSTGQDNLVFQSADLMVYPHSGQVEIQGEIVKLGLINMQVLVVLLEHAGGLASRTEFFDRVWKNQTVSDDVLTRSISELRSQLGRYSSHSLLIETLPKRGYRWVPKAFGSSDTEGTVASAGDGFFKLDWKRFSKMFAGSLLLLLLFSMFVLWLIDTSLRTDMVRVALVPVYASQPDQESIAADIDDIIKTRLMTTENLRYFAQSALESSSQKSFPYISREFEVDWIIEGVIRKRQNKFHISLSLVDARTALVVYSSAQDVDNDPRQMERFCTQFINGISRFVGEEKGGAG